MKEHLKHSCNRCHHHHHPTVPSSEVLGDGRPAAEQVGSQRLQLLTETQHGAERLAVLVQTRVELLDVQQGLLVHKLQELLGLFGHLRRDQQCLQEDAWTRKSCGSLTATAHVMLFERSQFIASYVMFVVITIISSL